MDNEKQELFREWAILELMGHRRLAGFVQEVAIGGQGLIRIDIPSEPPITQYYGIGSIYCLTPTTEELARAIAKQSRPEPVHRYELPPANAGLQLSGRESDIFAGEDECLEDEDEDEDADEIENEKS